MESVITEADINYKQIINIEERGKFQIVFYEDFSSHQIGIVLLKKNLFSWKFISRGGYVKMTTTNYPWSFSLQNINGSHIPIYYGYFTDKDIDKVSVSYSKNNILQEETAKLIDLESGFGRFWYSLINQSEQEWDVNNIKINFHKNDGSSFTQ